MKQELESWAFKIYRVLFYLTFVFLFLRGDILKFSVADVQISFSSTRNLLLALFGVGGAVLLLRQPRLHLGNFLHPLLLMWLCVLFLSVGLSQHVEESFKALGVVFSYGAFFYVVRSTVQTTQHVRCLLLLGTPIAIGVCVTDLAYFMYQVSVSPVVPIVEDFPFWPGKNILGLLCVLNASMALGLLLVKHSLTAKGKILAFLVLLLQGAVLAITFSRSAWVSFAAVMLTLAFLRPRIFGPLILVGVVAFFLWAPTGLKGRLFSVANFEEENVKERLRIWKSATKMVQDYPLNGVGLGCFHEEYLAKYRMKKIRLKWAGDHAHNLYLHVAAETGLLGLCTLFLTLGTLLWRGWQAWQKQGEPFLKAIQLGTFLAWIGFVTYSLTDSTFNGRFTDASLFHVNLLLVLLAALLVKNYGRNFDCDRQLQHA